jgi:hypothetical protein
LERAYWQGEGWFPQRGVSLEELTEPPNRDKVVYSGKVISFKETMWLRTMMFLGIGCSIVGSTIKVVFSMKGR